MANLILTATGWEQRIRSKVGCDIAYLSDADCAQPDVINIAEANIIEMVPDYASMTGTDKVYLEAATVCECAILVCPSMPARLPTREQGPHATYELTVDWAELQSKLEDDRDSYISKIVTLAVVPRFSVV